MHIMHMYEKKSNKNSLIELIRIANCFNVNET